MKPRNELDYGFPVDGYFESFCKSKECDNAQLAAVAVRQWLRNNTQTAFMDMAYEVSVASMYEFRAYSLHCN